MNLSAAGQAVACSALVRMDVPAAGLAFRLRLPADWQPQSPPTGACDFADPLAVQTVATFRATYGAVVFGIAVRPAYAAVSAATWLAAYAAAQPVVVGETGTLRLADRPAPMCVARRASSSGLLREQLALLVDADRMYLLSASAPEGLWPAVRAVFEQSFNSFTVLRVVPGLGSASHGIAA